LLFIFSRSGDMLENAYLMVAIILVITIVYVSFFTVRMILTLKGRKYSAAFVSMFEVVVYILGLGLVLDNMDAIQNIIAYAVGYGTGVIVGRSEEHTSELQSRFDLVCRLLLE